MFVCLSRRVRSGAQGVCDETDSRVSSAHGGAAGEAPVGLAAEVPNTQTFAGSLDLPTQICARVSTDQRQSSSGLCRAQTLTYSRSHNRDGMTQFVDTCLR